MNMVLSVTKGLLFKSGRVEPTVYEKKKEADFLRDLWNRGEGPEVNGIDIDYSYYSPVENGADPEKKYPLVVIMAGALEGVVQGFELTANALALWTAERFQKRFHNENAFLLIGRAPEEQKLYWDSDKVVLPFKAAIDSFIAAQPQVDTSRVYAVGWCLGGTGIWNLTSAFPKFFAAALAISPSRAVTEKEAARLCETPMWIMGCEQDNYVSFQKIVQKSWQRVRNAHRRPSELRYTTCATAPGVFLAGVIPFIQNHNMWHDLAEDLHPETKYCDGMHTVTAAGETIGSPYAIEWLNAHQNETGAGKAEKEWSPDFGVRWYEFWKVPFRGTVTLVMLHILDALDFIQLYH